VGVQQSLDARHDAPSSEQEPLHVRANSNARQLPAQHSEVKAQAPASGTQDPATAAVPQRLRPLTSPMQPWLPGQQSLLVPQKSPFDAQPDRSAQRPTPSAPTTQAPEQHSAFSAHSSQTLAHPPAGTQRLIASEVDRQRREQQSTSPAQGSPTGLKQVRPSAAVQIAREAQRPALTPLPTQEPEQQSEPLPQISPATRHASTSAQR
jgi:hypothetical protein